MLRAGLRRRPRSRSTTPARAMRARTATARRSAIMISPGSAPDKQEPVEFPRAAAAARGLRHQRSGVRLYARARPGGSVIDKLAAHDRRASPIRRMAAHLDRLASRPEGRSGSSLIASEAALWGASGAGAAAGDVIVSDDAGQFDVGGHALCWVHAERLVHKLDPFTDQHRTARSIAR